MRITVANEDRADAWDAYVQRAGGATFYHCYAWKKAMQGAYGLKAFYFMAEDGDSVRGILPLAVVPQWRGCGVLVSTPYANYGGVVADCTEARVMLTEAALGALDESGCDYLEMKQFDSDPAPGWIERLDYHALVLPLAPDPEQIWTQQLNTKVRNQTRKAMKQGFNVSIGPEYMPDFLRVYRRNLRDLGTPPHSARWYRELEELLGDRLTVIVAYLDGHPVAGAWLFCFRDTVFLHAAASLKSVQGMCPNNLVYWKAIEWAALAGYGYMDFCRSRVDAGSYHFKQQWGAEPRQIYYRYLPGKRHHFPDVDPHNPKYKTAIAIWRHVPLVIADRVGPMLRSRITT